MSDFPSVKLHVVTGKGGTGKTTVAGALALALAAGGRQVLLTEVEEGHGIWGGLNELERKRLLRRMRAEKSA